MFEFTKTPNGYQVHFKDKRHLGVVARLETITTIAKKDIKGHQFEEPMGLNQKDWTVTLAGSFLLPDLEQFVQEIPKDAL